MESEYGLEIGDDEWWKEAEKRVLRDARQARRRARLRLVARWLPLALVASVVGAGGVWVVRNDRLPSLPTRSDTAGEAAEVVNPELTENELREPFVGTPAASLLTEGDGIVLPEPHAVGRYSAAEIGARFRTVKELLTLSRFDARMVQRRDPSALLARLGVAERRRLAAELRGRESGHLVVSRLAPGSSLLAPTRVHGFMSARIGEYGELVVATDYAFTYALRPAGPVVDRTSTHVIIRAQVSYGFLADRRYKAEDQGIYLASAGGYVFNIDCDQYLRGLLALPTRNYLGSEPMSEEERKRLYRADGPMPVTSDDCGGQSPAPKPTPTPSAAGTPV